MRSTAMKRKTGSLRFFCFFLVLAVLAACGPKFKPPRPARVEHYLDATPQELIEDIETNFSGIRNFKASCGMGFRFSGAKKMHSCKGKMLFEAPNRMYLRGYRSLLGTFFTLKTDGSVFSVHVPRRKETFQGTEAEGLTKETGEDHAIIDKLRPSHILEALLLGPLDLEGENRKTAFAILPDQYILSVFRTAGETLVPARTIRIDRKALRVREHETFGEDGTLLGRYTFHRYIEVGDTYLPKDVWIKRFWEGIELRFSLSNVKFDTEVDPKAFVPDAPIGKEKYP